MHEFRGSLTAKWKKVGIEDDSVKYFKNDNLIKEIPIRDIERVQITRQMPGIFSAKIKSKTDTISIGTNAPKEVATPRQAVDTFATFLEDLRVHPQNVGSYKIGSSLILFFSIIIIAVSLIGLILGLISIVNGGLSGIKVILTSGVLLVIGISIAASGLPKKYGKIDELPYDLFIQI